MFSGVALLLKIGRGDKGDIIMVDGTILVLGVAWPSANMIDVSSHYTTIRQFNVNH